VHWGASLMLIEKLAALSPEMSLLQKSPTKETSFLHKIRVRIYVCSCNKKIGSFESRNVTRFWWNPPILLLHTSIRARSGCLLLSTQCVSQFTWKGRCVVMCCNVLQCVLQCVAVFCSVLQCVAVWWTSLEKVDNGRPRGLCPWPDNCLWYLLPAFPYRVTLCCMCCVIMCCSVCCGVL